MKEFYQDFGSRFLERDGTLTGRFRTSRRLTLSFSVASRR